MTNTPNLALPYLDAAQAQKHVTHNEALRIIDAATQIAVLDLTRTAPPSSPAEGQRHIVAASPTGAWAGHARAIAKWQDGAWAFLAPNAGWCVWSVADAVMFVYDGAAWRDQRNLAVDNVAHLGVNTTSTSPNLLSVKSNAALLAAINAADGGSGDVRLQLSKESAARTASVVFSDAYSGRAEFGLVGSDAFRLKVSADGASFVDAFVIDQATGTLSLPRGLALSGALSPPQITANQNDYAPAGSAVATTLRLSSDAARSITGIGGGGDGLVKLVANVGSFNLVLSDSDAGSAAANRFAFGFSLTLGAGQAALLWYDTAASRWKLIAANAQLADGSVAAAKLDSATAAKQTDFRSAIAAAPVDALAFSGMQVNGHHDISQQNGDAAVAIPAGAQSIYVTDNWKITKSGASVLSAQRVASGLDAIACALQVTVTTAQPTIGADTASFVTCIEGARVARAGWGTASAAPISGGMWFKAAVAGSYTVVASNFDGSSSQSATFSIAAANAWTYVTFTLPAKTSGTWKTDSSLGLSLQVLIAGAGLAPNNLAGAGNVCAITGLLVLPGLQVPSQADLPRALRSGDIEAAACDRLWQTFGGAYSGYSYTFGVGTTATATVGVICIRLRGNGMRQSPTMSISSPADFLLLDGSGYTPSAISLDSADVYQVMIALTASGLTFGRGLWLRSANSNARLYFNARF